jgi:hypothetical protein
MDTESDFDPLQKPFILLIPCLQRGPLCQIFEEFVIEFFWRIDVVTVVRYQKSKPIESDIKNDKNNIYIDLPTDPLGEAALFSHGIRNCVDPKSVIRHQTASNSCISK